MEEPRNLQQDFEEDDDVGSNELDDKTGKEDSCSTTPMSIDAAKGSKQKVPVKYIANRTRRHVTFAKRRHGIMKKAYELSVLTGANVLLLILSNSGLIYTFTTPKLEPIVREEAGKTLIRQCLRAADDETLLDRQLIDL